MRGHLTQLTVSVLVGALAWAGASASKADGNRGRELFEKRCTGCHSLDRVKAGPPLRAVFGRPAARDPQFPYSDALKQARVSWDEATLDKWLADPESLVRDNDMSFRLDNAAERADIISYLKQLESR